MNIITIIISGVLGILGGAVSSTGKPLIDWHIEQKRDRKKLVQGWRKAIKTELEGGQDFIESEVYLDLRPHLTSEEINKLEHTSNSITIVGGAIGLSANKGLSTISSAVDRVSREWKLL